MSTSRRAPPATGACAACLRRSWLLSALSGPLEYCARDRGRLIELLALGDAELLQALAGRRATELKDEYARFGVEQPAHAEGVEAICRHCRGYPRVLDGRAAPHMLEVAGGARRLARLTAAPMVALVGSRAPSDYGIEIARGLARGLAASGVGVVASFTDGIAVAAHAGALEVGTGSVAVMGGGLGVSCPPRRRSLYERVTRGGCAVSELPLDCAGRRWGQLASERIVVELGLLTVVVEADTAADDLAAARIALALGRTVAAIPGRVTSPLSRGTHALLMAGASLVRGPRDVLELLGPIETPRPFGKARPGHGGVDTHARLPPALRTTLAHVGTGYDTPDKLARAGGDDSELLLALSQLELMGLLVRGDGGRYLPRYPLD
jgi:DNA processing protein